MQLQVLSHYIKSTGDVDADDDNDGIDDDDDGNENDGVDDDDVGSGDDDDDDDDDDDSDDDGYVIDVTCHHYWHFFHQCYRFVCGSMKLRRGTDEKWGGGLLKLNQITLSPMKQLP